MYKTLVYGNPACSPFEQRRHFHTTSGPRAISPVFACFRCHFCTYVDLWLNHIDVWLINELLCRNKWAPLHDISPHIPSATPSH